MTATVDLGEPARGPAIGTADPAAERDRQSVPAEDFLSNSNESRSTKVAFSNVR
jgi:hypothetical protein